MQVQANGVSNRRALSSASLQAGSPGPSQGASQDIKVDGTSGFAATVVSGATDLASKVVGSTQGFASAAQTIVDTITTRKKAPILLMHGAIQGGWVWELPRISNGAPLGVKGLLQQAGFTVYNPTLPFHSPTNAWNLADGQVNCQTYVDTWKKTILDNDLQNTTLVGHSLAGVWMQLLLQQIPERIGMMIFIDAVALEPGESFFSNQIAGLVPTYPVYPSQALFTIMFSYPLFYQEFNIEVYKDYFTNTMANDTALIDGTYALMVPEPHGPEVQVMDTTQFFQIPMPKAYISLTQDFTLSSNYKSWLLFSDRVKKANNGGVPYQVYEVYGDHESMLTQPSNLALGILKAINGMHQE
ncbi:g6512 [Coccomyxa viridis]|uniref:G6512 protein n=1 Tax=Coccomyxa viridis TaxID=1274662 RepID=A0ABP1FVJ0_9CHLO